jgi:hypothetical protein
MVASGWVIDQTRLDLSNTLLRRDHRQAVEARTSAADIMNANFFISPLS